MGIEAQKQNKGVMPDWQLLPIKLRFDWKSTEVFLCDLYANVCAFADMVISWLKQNIIANMDSCFLFIIESFIDYFKMSFLMIN